MTLNSSLCHKDELKYTKAEAKDLAANLKPVLEHIIDDSVLNSSTAARGDRNKATNHNDTHLLLADHNIR